MTDESSGPDEDYERLVEDIASVLITIGFVRVEAADLTVSTAIWRRAAREAGRRYSLRVSTGRAGGQPDLTPRAPHHPEGAWSVWAQAVPFNTIRASDPPR